MTLLVVVPEEPDEDFDDEVVEVAVVAVVVVGLLVELAVEEDGETVDPVVAVLVATVTFLAATVFAFAVVVALFVVVVAGAVVADVDFDDAAARPANAAHPAADAATTDRVMRRTRRRPLSRARTRAFVSWGEFIAVLR